MMKRNLKELKKISNIIPNNTKIINTLDTNLELLSTEQKCIYYKFKQHAEAFEMNSEDRMDLEAVPIFPLDFKNMINIGGK